MMKASCSAHESACRGSPAPATTQRKATEQRWLMTEEKMRVKTVMFPEPWTMQGTRGSRRNSSLISGKDFRGPL